MGGSQINRRDINPGVVFQEVWDRQENILAMQGKSVEKQDVYRRFIGCFRTAYANQDNWSEPPAAHKIGNTTLAAEPWGVMVLYNGAAGVPSTHVPGRVLGFRSPWIFNPNNGNWTFHDNVHDYASDRVRPELEGIINSQE